MNEESLVLKGVVLVYERWKIRLRKFILVDMKSNRRALSGCEDINERRRGNYNCLGYKGAMRKHSLGRPQGVANRDSYHFLHWNREKKVRHMRFQVGLQRTIYCLMVISSNNHWTEDRYSTILIEMGRPTKEDRSYIALSWYHRRHEKTV